MIDTVGHVLSPSPEFDKSCRVSSSEKLIFQMDFGLGPLR